MRLAFKIFFISFVLICVERLCHLATDGFAMVNVYPPPHDDNSIWKTLDPLDSNLLSSTYHYYASGSQSYVFLSEDGKTILKLFKFQHMRIPPWLEFFPSNAYLTDKREKKREVLEKTFNSIFLAYNLMREESALLFIHLAPTKHLKTQITLIDKIGKKHLIDLDTTPFLLQKKGVLVYDAIDAWMKKGEVEKVKKGIQELLILSLHRCKKGLFDKDPDFSTNFGFIENTPFHIDFGRFTLDPKEKDPLVHRPEMVRITRNFRHWIEKNHPTLLSYFDQQLLLLLE